MTLAVDELGSLPTAILDEQVIVGRCVSLTVTVKLQLEWLFDASVAEQVTVVVPNWNCEPEAGEQLLLTPGQLSAAAGES